jgi:phospholipid/cholesterol/gamma-HCH transport system permease protein
LLARVGKRAHGLGIMLLGHVDFLGRVSVELVRALRQPAVLRRRELAAQLGQVGVTAIPVVALVTFLIGVVFAYLLGLQAEQYGANIFVVDGVALGITREFSPLIVSTIVAGRSGAAFTAQLGTMKLTEEIDAIRTLGLSAEQVLVVPRVLALMLTLPLLVFVGDLTGLMGAMAIAQWMLDVTPHTFIERLHVALDPRHYLIGLGKAPFFALAIAVIGCRMGIGVERDTRSIGINTTSTVVQSIVAVIILDAVFAVFFQNVGW